MSSLFDPKMTYNPPQRGIVPIESEKPRERLKQLYKHYEKRGDFEITFKFLRRRDWLVLPSRIKQLQQQNENR